MKYLSCLSLIGVIIISGCYSNLTLDTKNATDIGNEKILSAIYTSGDTVIFNSDGGKIELLNNYVIGRTIEDDELMVHIQSIKEFRIKIPEGEKTNNLPGKKIREVIDTSNVIYTFNVNGAEYDTANGIVEGTLKDGGKFSEPLNHLTSIFIETPETMTIEQLSKNETIKIRQLIIKNNRVFTFDENGGKLITDKNYVVGKKENGKDCRGIYSRWYHTLGDKW